MVSCVVNLHSVGFFSLKCSFNLPFSPEFLKQRPRSGLELVKMGFSKLLF